MTVRLDPRPERRLTSREISKIIGGAIGGLLQTEIPADHIRAALEATRAVAADNGTPDVSVPSSHTWAAALSGVVGGLLQWCDIWEVLVAIDWLLEHWSEIAS